MGNLAEGVGLRPEYIADLKFLNEQLKYAARAWGDPLSDLEGAKLIRYRGLTTYLRVFYAAHYQSTDVFVSGIAKDYNNPNHLIRVNAQPYLLTAPQAGDHPDVN